MSDIAIRVENLSKRYRIGGPQERYKTLRDTIMDAAVAPARRLRRLGQPTPPEETIWALKDVSFEVKRGWSTATRTAYFCGRILDHAAVAWKRHVLAARKAKQYENRYLEVRCEELLASGPDMLKSVFDFCGLPASVQDVTAIVKAHRVEKMKASKMTPARSVKAPDGAYRKGKVGSWKDISLIKSRVTC